MLFLIDPKAVAQLCKYPGSCASFYALKNSILKEPIGFPGWTRWFMTEKKRTLALYLNIPSLSGPPFPLL